MYSFVLILFLVKTTTTVRVGRIQDAIWTFNSSNSGNEYINITNTTCEQCLCQMLAMNNLTTSIACQSKWGTCQLLLFNATAQLQTDNTSIVYIQTITLFPQVPTSQPLASSSVSPTSKLDRRNIT